VQFKTFGRAVTPQFVDGTIAVALATVAFLQIATTTGQ
jgi:hypothetical protein